MSTPHQHNAAGVVARFAVVTLSDTRTLASDRSGSRLRELLGGAGHVEAHYELIPDEPARLDALLAKLIADAGVDLIVTNGGTGISRRDQTVGVIQKWLTVPLPGFGELFRMLSFAEIGSAAMLSRALGGLAGGKLLFALPGSTPAVELGATRLIIPEIPHLLSELRKQS